MKKLLIFIAVAAIISAGAWYYRGKQRANAPADVSPTPSAVGSVSPAPSATPSPTPSRTPLGTPVSASPTPGLIVNEVKFYTVVIQNFAFVPTTLTVKKGDLIQFTNLDSSNHTVTSLTGKFESGSMPQNASWDLETANMAPGTYEYRCNIHPTMRGTIVVQ
ncbi:MAG: cupredoxin domain-containing protein [Patescibacteria group bacterium]